ncbi:MAG: META domain-containing protein [Tannerellaceae bacterium]|jgi:heat shock protein HslJ|nr:META domain-containing protein [Tannerellaceae bacterium]
MGKAFYLCACLALIFAACKTQRAAVSLNSLDGEWNIVALNGAQLNPEEAKQYLRFDAAGRRLSGNAGCNLISGEIEYKGTEKNALAFRKVVSTLRACLDMRLEDELLKTLDRVVRFEAETPRRITFYSADNQQLFVLEKRADTN